MIKLTLVPGGRWGSCWSWPDGRRIGLGGSTGERSHPGGFLEPGAPLDGSEVSIGRDSSIGGPSAFHQRGRFIGIPNRKAHDSRPERLHLIALRDLGVSSPSAPRPN